MAPAGPKTWEPGAPDPSLHEPLAALRVDQALPGCDHRLVMTSRKTDVRTMGVAKFGEDVGKT